MKIKTILLGYFLAISSIASANEVEVVDVKATQNSDKTWNFQVTLKHTDEGWDHYANEWQVIAPDNKILATRTLYHPHVNEQPFTRGTRGVKIPENIRTVRVIAKDTKHGLSKNAVELDLASHSVKQITLDLVKAKKTK
jgi:hypothetical protein